MLTARDSLITIHGNRLIQDELNYDTYALASEFQQLLAFLMDEQKKIMTL